MKKYLWLLLVLLPVSVASIASLTRSDDSPSTPLPAWPSFEPAGLGASRDCDNVLFPVADGNAWRYSIEERQSAGSYRRSSVSLTIESDEGKFVVRTPDGARVEWQCWPEGLEVVGPTVGGFPFYGNIVAADFEVFDSNKGGITLPRQVREGDSWPEFKRVRIHDPSGGKAWVITDARTTASGVKSVKVPAGEFKAMRFEGKDTIELDLPPSMGADMGGTYRFTSWWAPGIGLVKAVSTMPDGKGPWMRFELISSNRGQGEAE